MTIAPTLRSNEFKYDKSVGEVLTRRGDQWVTRGSGRSAHKQADMPGPHPTRLPGQPVSGTAWWAAAAAAKPASSRKGTMAKAKSSKKPASKRPASMAAAPATVTAWHGRNRQALSEGSRGPSGRFGFRTGGQPAAAVHPATRPTKKARKKAAKKAAASVRAPRSNPASFVLHPMYGAHVFTHASEHPAIVGRPTKKARKKAAKKAARKVASVRVVHPASVHPASARPAKKARKKAASRRAPPSSSSASRPMNTAQLFKRLGIRG